MLDLNIQGARKARLPAFMRPQLATLVESVPSAGGWLHEVKFDGYRILCRFEKGRVALLTREAKDWTARFKSVADAAAGLPVTDTILDGEVVALRADGTADFQALQNSLRRGGGNLTYFVFDLLYLNGYDLTAIPLLARKEALAKILESRDTGGALRYSGHWIDQGEALFEQACRMGLEGVVSKRPDRPYRPGRSRDWVKAKCLKGQEFVIGGFTDPAGSRTGFGALLLGFYDAAGSLHYAGRVGTGFNSRSLSELRSRLDDLTIHSTPFVNPPTGAGARGVHWVKPQLACEVLFTGWTEDGLLRHPSFKGLREDKAPREIRREEAARQQKIDDR
ncbi:MAG: non-homologous end-joining DNA ligase [Candidatus Binatia bacterium]